MVTYNQPNLFPNDPHDTPCQACHEAQREQPLNNIPIVRERKNRAAKKALHHGLSFGLFCPHGGKMGVNYSQIHAELMKEFQPDTFSGCMEVASLAGNYLSLAHFHQLIWQAIHPRTLWSPEEFYELNAVHAAQEDLASIHRILAIRDIPDEPVCTMTQAQSLAARLGMF